MISQDTIDKIIQQANIVETISGFTTLQRIGKDYLIECPACGKYDLKKKKGMTVSPAKNIAKCFSCDAGANPVSYLMDYQNFDYPAALKFLAEKYNIIIDEKPQPKGPQKKLNKQTVSFRDKQLSLSGLTDDDQKVHSKVDNDKTVIVNAFEQGTIDQYGNITAGDDMIIYYYDLDGRPVKYQKKEGGKFELLYRVRWQIPELHPDKDGRPVKYKSPYGSGSHLYIPDAIRRKYADKRVINRLFIQEGEKKAEKACKHGFDSVGIMGIQNIARDGKLPYEFQQIIKDCQVKEVIFLLDSDWNELSHNLKPEQRVDMRPSNFFYAVKNFKDYFKAFINIGIHIETYFGYINKTETIQDKGIDDLLTNTLSGKEIELINDFTQAINNIKETNGKGKYISLVKISTMADLKLQEYWNLHSAEAFAEFYKDELINLATFKIKKYLWRFNDDGKLELAQPLLDDEMFFERQVRFDKSGNERIEYKFRWLYAYNFLKRRGYGRLMMASGQFIYIYVENGVVQVVDSYQIKDFMIDLAKEIAPKRELADIMDMLYRGGKMYFGPDSLSNIDFLQPKFELAASDYQYMFFQDSYIKITADSIEEDTFDKLKTYVWSDKIKDHKLKIYDNPLIHVDVITLENIKALPAEQQHQLKQFIGQYSIDFTEEALKSDFLQYIIKTSDLNWREAYQEDRKTLKNNHELAHAIETNLQILSKLTAIGYLIHNYFDAANSKAVIAMDAKNSEVGESHGGSGKSLFGDAISKMVNTVVINGKNKKLTDDPFWAEEVTEKTDVVFIDDVRANVDFEFFFPCITGKFVVNPKNGKKFTIPRDQTPKIFIPTNHAINGDGSSFTRRQSFIMFSDFYGDTYSPLDDFGKRMFDEWDYNQWNLFYNISAICIQLYLKYGLIQPPSDKIDTRRLRQSIGENFIIWCDEYFAETFEERFKRKDLFEVYMEKNGHERKYTTPYIFKKKIIKYCQYRGLLYNAHLDGKDEKSNGVEWFTIQKKQS